MSDIAELLHQNSKQSLDSRLLFRRRERLRNPLLKSSLITPANKVCTTAAVSHLPDELFKVARRHITLASPVEPLEGCVGLKLGLSAKFLPNCLDFLLALAQMSE